MLRNFIMERERIWCDEEIPALGGLTPREAAADPSGRESLDRLLAEYGSHIDPERTRSWCRNTPIASDNCSDSCRHEPREWSEHFCRR